MQVVVALIGVALCAAQGPPSDWLPRIEDGQMLFSLEPPGSPLLMPAASNGFVGAVVGRGGVFEDEQFLQPVMQAAGVFTGVSNATPSHRAAVPSPWAAEIWPETPQSPVGAALDIERGVFLNRTRIAPGSAGCEAGGVVEQRFLASSCHADLLLWQVALVEGSRACRVPLRWTLPVPSMTAADFAPGSRWKSVNSSVSVWHAQTQAAETPSTGIRTVALAVQHDGLANNTSSNSSFVLQPGGPAKTFRAVFHSDLDAADPLDASLAALATYTAADGDALRVCSEQQWAQVRWQSGLETSGNLTVARALNSSLFHLLSAGIAEWPFSYSPSGLAFGSQVPQQQQQQQQQPQPRATSNQRVSDGPHLGYHGHSFWDADLWISTGLALLRPELSGMIVEYRAARLPAALQRAQQYGFVGANWPWESAFSGVDTVAWPNIEGQYEQHISSDIALNLRWLYRLTGNVTWLRAVAWPMLQETCVFWHCRFQQLHPDAHSSPTPAGGQNCGVKNGTGGFTILRVQPPDERAGVVNSSIYTNAAAAAVLDFCVEAATVLGDRSSIPVAEYEAITKDVYLPLSSTLWPGHLVHPEFQGYAGQQINQASVTLLQWPLQSSLAGNQSVRADDLAYYAQRIPFDGMFTGDSSLSVAALELGNRSLADAQWELGLQHDNTPFGVWKERAATVGNPNFITGVGGMVQNVLNGFFGLRAPGAGKLGLFAPSLPKGVTGMAVRGLQFLGHRLRLQLDGKQVCAEEMAPVQQPPLPPGVPPRWVPSSARLQRWLGPAAARAATARLPGARMRARSPTQAGLSLVAADGTKQPIVRGQQVCTPVVAGVMLGIEEDDM